MSLLTKTSERYGSVALNTIDEFRREYRSDFPDPNTWPPEKRIHISNNQDTPPIADDDYRLAGTAPNKTWVSE